MNNLRILREEVGLSQMDLGAAVGVSSSAIQQYEAGTNNPSLKTFVRLADYFHVTLDYMADRTMIRDKLETVDEQLASEVQHLQNPVAKQAVLDILRELKKSK